MSRSAEPSPSSLSRRRFLEVSAAAGIAAGCVDEPPIERRRPNLLLLFPDQLRFDWTSANPQIPVRMPNLDRLAARGVRFRNAYCASPLCAPSRACLAAGKEYDRAGVPSNAVNYAVEQTTYYSLLRESGYHVMGCGKFDLHKPDPSWGEDGQHLLNDWGFSSGIDSAGKWDAIRWGADKPCDPYTAYLHDNDLIETHVADFERRREVGTFLATFPTPLPADAYCDNWISEQGLRLLREAPSDQPWHLAVNWAGPHEPVDITEPMDDWYADVDFPQPNRNTELPPEKHVEIRRNYSAMVENLDRWIGRFVDLVEERGELENTLIVFSSDHGEMLGDHNLWQKIRPHQPSVAVPLVIAGPDTAQGATSDALASVMDLAATFLDYAGVDIPAEMDSRSLAPVLRGEQGGHREVLLSGLNPWRTAFDGRYKLIEGYDPAGPSPNGKPAPYFEQPQAPPPLLFDIAQDPLENQDRAAELPAEVARLREAIRPPSGGV